MTKLLQQCLDALTRLSFLGNGDFPGNSEGNRIAQKAVSDIKQALAQQEQPAMPTHESIYETIINWDEGGGKRSRRELARRIEALYTHPEQPAQEPGTAGQQRKEFESVTRPVIEWLNANCCPHVTVVITPISAELSAGQIAYSTTEFVRN